MPGAKLPVATFGTPADGTFGFDENGDFVFRKGGVTKYVLSGNTPTASYDGLSTLVNTPYTVSAHEALAASKFSTWIEATATVDCVLRLPPRSGNVGKLIGVRRSAGYGSTARIFVRPDTQLFVGSGISGGTVSAVKVQADGKVILGGTFTGVNGTTVGRLARINTDGSLDTTFNTNIGTGASSGAIYTIDIDSSGNIFVGGTFTAFGTSTTDRIVKLSSAGVIDSTFSTNAGTGPNGDVRSIYIRQSDDKVFVGGSFDQFNGATYNRFVALNNDGTLYTTFNANTGSQIGTTANRHVYAVHGDSSGNVFVGGLFSLWNGASRANFVKLSSTGTESSFASVSGGTVPVFDIRVQSDGKILVGGDFNTLAGATVYKFGRLNTDGTADTTFNTNVGALVTTGEVSEIAIDSTGRIIIVGDIGASVFGGGASRTPRGVCRFSSAGVPDEDWDTVYPHNNGQTQTQWPTTVDVDGSDNVVIGGNYEVFGSTQYAAAYATRIPEGGNIPFSGVALLNNNEVILRVTDTGWSVVSQSLATDWVSAGAITPSATTTAPTKGTVSEDTLWWRRTDAGVCQFRYEYVQSTGGTNGSGTYLIPFVWKAYARVVNIAGTGTVDQPRNSVGHGECNGRHMHVMLYNESYVYAQGIIEAANSLWSSAAAAWSGTNYFTLRFDLPIVDL